MLLDFDPSDLIKSKDYVLRKAVANNGQCLENSLTIKTFVFVLPLLTKDTV